MGSRPGFEINGEVVEAGSRRTIDLPISVLSNHTPLALPVCVVHGQSAGPTVFLSAAIHGDEVIGVEIIRRVLAAPALKKLRGTLLAVPVVNAFGFIARSRYLPDRRDLNRSFPGSSKGSLAAQVADLFLTQVVKRAEVGIDLHSAAIHRVNLPQVRVSRDSDRALALAKIFGAPLVITAPLREGSLRHVAAESGTDILLYEAGEALRFDELAVRAGVTGILRVMKHLEMIRSNAVREPKVQSALSESSHWLRAPAGGLFRGYKTIGDMVDPDDLIGVIADPFGETETEVRTPRKGLIIGRTNLPMVNQGDGLAHIAALERAPANGAAEIIEAELQSDPLFDEDEII